MAEVIKLQDPHEVKGPEGCEGWEEMYPYQYLFTTVDKARTEYEKTQFWVQDSLHTPEPLYPFDVQEDEQWWCCLSQMNTRVWMTPAAKGLDHRMLYGYTYINPIAIEDPKIIEERIPLFMKRAGYYYENWTTRLYRNMYIYYCILEYGRLQKKCTRRIINQN